MVDVTEMAREAGLMIPTVVTAAVWEIINQVPPDSGQNVGGRLRNIQGMLKVAIKKRKSAPGNTIHYSLWIDRTSRKRKPLRLKAVIKPGSGEEPVITIMLPDEK